MMQQQICPPDQLGQPQQVMLCPVRLVYETQIVVQPGEQLQPNQTLFINPQNPPPWIQNQVRPQNQVIYMQQMPSNLMPSVPQQMDQNQMYLQNLQSYYPQQMIHVDPRQMSNVVQMMPNINNISQVSGQNVNLGQNIISVGQNVSHIGPNLINTGQNIMPVSNVVQNVQKPAQVGANIAQNHTNMAIVSNDRGYNNTNVMPNTIPMANQNSMTNMTQIQDRTVNMNQNLINMQKVAELQGMRQQNTRQPQMTVSPLQNVKYTSNSVDIRPISQPNVGDVRAVNSPRPMTVTSNIPNNVMQANALNKKVPLQNKPNPTVMTNPVRHYNQSYYRHIQPKPMSVSPLQTQYAPVGTQTLNGPRPTQTISDVNRKRKSESPDETRRKMPNMCNHTVSVTETENGTQISYIPTPVRDFKLVERNVKTASTGTQANIPKWRTQPLDTKIEPASKDNAQIENDKLVRNTVFTQARGLLRTEPHNPQTQPDVIIRIEKLHSPIKGTPEPMTIVTSEANAEPTSIETLQPNTEIVKIEPTKTKEAPKLETRTPNIELLKLQTPKADAGPAKIEPPKETFVPQVLSENIDKQRPSTTKQPPLPPSKIDVVKIDKRPNEESPKMNKSRTPETKTSKQSAESPKIETITKVESKSKEVKTVKVKKEENIKPLKLNKEEKTLEAIKSEVSKPVKSEAKEVKEVNRKFTVTSINDFKGNELQIADGSVKKEDTDHFILTHVLDGYVIQESNTAFPIRKPLKEKIIYQNAAMSLEPKKEESYKHRTEDGKIIKDNSKILSISDLNLNEEEELKSDVESMKSEETVTETESEEEMIEAKCDEVSESDQPFADVTAPTVKSWTVDQLSSHLSKFNWTETMSVLSEHEIDGESLFLVNKQQLVQIGVGETHADVICEFIKHS